ncbi:MAG: ATP-binding protein [Myxococcota bacterium]|nr:ATP-binding protein [Myxococcota bacterium]
MRILEVTRSGSSPIAWSDDVEVTRVDGLVAASHALEEGRFQVVALHSDAVDAGLMSQVSALPVVVTEKELSAKNAIEYFKLGAKDYATHADCESACLDIGIAEDPSTVDLSGLSAEGTWLLHADLIEREKLATVGQLATGLAHAINNPSAYVVANLNELGACLNEVRALLLEALKDAEAHADEERQEDLEGLKKAAMYPAGLDEMDDMVEECLDGMKRITGIVNSLQGFRDDSENPRPTDVPRAIETALKLAENELRGRASLETDLGECPRVMAVPGRLSQVFFDLVSNSIQSFDTEGEKLVRVRCWVEGEEVRVSIDDNGRGIPDELLARIWDPFFTIQEGHGSLGLGLSICRDIIHRYGGEVEIASTFGEGTKVLVRLPIPVEFIPLANPDPDLDPLEQARILVIDDEPAILRTVRRILREAADVQTASSGKEALKVLLGENHLDLVLCDLDLGEISGADLHHRLCEEKPEMANKIWFISGGPAHPRLQDFAQRHRDRMIEKPFEPDELRDRIRRALS